MKSAGVTVKPIANLTGESHFNEVFLDDVFVPETMLIGAEGDGWRQVGAELAYERSGPERYLSSIRLFLEFLRVVGDKPSEAERLLIGEMTARMWTLRQMSLSVVGQARRGREPGGRRRGGQGPRHLARAGHPARGAGDGAGASDEAFERTLSYLLQTSPSFSLRGGTREILRGIIARELGLR